MHPKTTIKFENIFSISGSLIVRFFTSTALHIYVSIWEKWTLTFYHVRLEWWLTATAHISLRLSECLNPIFYNLASRYLHFSGQDWTCDCTKLIHFCFKNPVACTLELWDVGLTEFFFSIN